MKLDENGRFVKAEHVLVQELDGEAVLLNMKSEFYFGLDEVGFRMFRLITTADSLKQAYEILASEYDVDPNQLRQDFDRLVRELLESSLISKANEDLDQT